MSLNNIYIILSKPQMGENIGSVARIMKNFGCVNLRIIAPRDGWPNEKAYEMSAHAKDIINNAEIFENLEEAISDISYLAATASVKRFISKEIINPEEAGKIITKKINNYKCGILFGRESSGLSNEEISACNQMVTIKTSDLYPSLNIAQACCVMLYEIFKNNSKVKKIINNNSKNLIANKSEYLSLVNFLEAQLERKNFFQVKEKKKNMMINIKNMFTKNNFTDQEIKTLKGIFALINK
ncbi:MAG: RNA methyltransferase [Rickettsiales bacterium]|nr:RNA methyltransferase [Rickettsiales bacterium]